MPTGDAPTTSEWSTILLPTKMGLIISEVWWYTVWLHGLSVFSKMQYTHNRHPISRPHRRDMGCLVWIQGCQPVRNFRILYGFYMQNTGVRIWPRKYGNWALSVLSLKVLLPEQSLPVLGSKSVRICGILCLRTFKYLFNHQNIQSFLFHM